MTTVTVTHAGTYSADLGNGNDTFTDPGFSSLQCHGVGRHGRRYGGDTCRRPPPGSTSAAGNNSFSSDFGNNATILAGDGDDHRTTRTFGGSASIDAGAGNEYRLSRLWHQHYPHRRRRATTRSAHSGASQGAIYGNQGTDEYYHRQWKLGTVFGGQGADTIDASSRRRQRSMEISATILSTVDDCLWTRSSAAKGNDTIDADVRTTVGLRATPAMI